MVQLADKREGKTDPRSRAARLIRRYRSLPQGEGGAAPEESALRKISAQAQALALNGECLGELGVQMLCESPFHSNEKQKEKERWMEALEKTLEAAPKITLRSLARATKPLNVPVAWRRIFLPGKKDYFGKRKTEALGSWLIRERGEKTNIAFKKLLARAANEDWSEPLRGCPEPLLQWACMMGDEKKARMLAKAGAPMSGGEKKLPALLALWMTLHSGRIGAGLRALVPLGADVWELNGLLPSRFEADKVKAKGSTSALALGIGGEMGVTPAWLAKVALEQALAKDREGKRFCLLQAQELERAMRANVRGNPLAEQGLRRLKEISSKIEMSVLAEEIAQGAQEREFQKKAPRRL